MSDPKSIHPPAHLTPFALEEWKRLAPLARRARTLTATTARSFEILCETLGTERRARELIERVGITVSTGGRGTSSKPHPAVRTLENARMQSTELLKIFRLYPGQLAAPADAGKRAAKSTWKGVL